MGIPLPDWLSVPVDVRTLVGKMVGASPVEVHRSHLPLLPPPVRTAILAANPPLSGPVGTVQRANGILRPYQDEAADFVRARHGSILAFQMGCVAGESVVHVNRGGAGRPYRVDVLWQRLHDPDRDRSHLWDPAIPTYVRALCNGELRLHRLVDVIAKGRKPVLKLTLVSGKNLRLTADHEIGMTDGRWLPVGVLVPGMLVLSNGVRVLRIHRNHRNMDGGTSGKGGVIQFVPVEDAVVSVAPDGEADVYDLVMADPHRNFVANGIVVHNCGKTRTALAATYAPDRIGIIVAPLVTWTVWKKEIALVYGNDYPVTEVRGKKLTEDGRLTRPGIYLLNPEIVRDRFSEWMAVRPEFCILDEAHLYINRQTRRHAGARSLVTRASHRVALTGTPILRHVVDLHGILNCVVPGAFGGWYDFAIELGGHHGKHGGVQIGVVAREALERLDARLADIMVRKRWEEVASFVPPLQRERLSVALSDADVRAYNRLMNDVRVVLGQRVSYTALMQAAKLIEVGALRRFIGRAKIPAVVDLACSTTEPVVVWTWHRDVAQAVAAGINKHEGGPAALVVTGEDDHHERDTNIERFQQSKARVIVCTIASAGLGIDFTVARIGIFAEQSWTPGEMSQAEARYFRSGQTRPCMTYWPIVEGSIEDRVLEVLQEKDRHAASGILAGVVSEARAGDAVLQSVVDLVDMVVEGR